MAQKKTSKKIEKPFNILESNVVRETQEAVHSLRARRKNAPVTLKSMADFSPYYLELDNFALQSVFGTRGFRGRTLVEVIATEGIGKTTLIFTLLGSLIRTANSPCLFINTEGEQKLPTAARIKRSLDTRPDIADKMYNIIQMDSCYELRQMVSMIEDFAKASREFLDKQGATNVPIVIAIDTLSKVMSPGEAAGIIEEKDEKKAAKAKDLGDSSNLEAAKLFHYWCRRMNYLFDKYNLLIISASHQNIKIDMSGFGSPMSSDVAAKYNKNKRGGKAFDQNAALQFTMIRTGFAKNSAGDPIGHKVQLRVVKSSVGADNNTLDFVLKTRDFADEEGVYQEPSLDFTEGLAEMFVSQKILGTTVSRKRYSSDELGVSGVTAKEFCDTFNAREDLKNKVGVQLGIDGYVPEEWLDDVDKAASSVSESDDK